MLQLDFFSMTIVVAVNLMTVAFALPWFMERKISTATRHAQQFLLLQGLAWLLVLTAARFEEFGMKSFFAGAAAFSSMSALWQLRKALQGWLGARNLTLTRTLALLCLAGVVSFLVLIESMPYRLGAFSICYGLAVEILAWMALYPQQPARKVWRYLLFGVGQCIALLMFIRSYITLQTPWLQSFADESPANAPLALLAPVLSTLLIVSILMAWRDETRDKELDDLPDDDLTGLPRRHALKGQARFMLHHARRERLPLTLILIDMDHFSRVNSRHGYQTGDEALQLMSRTLRKHMRGDEMVARWQGEAFCLLVHADREGARSLCTRLRSAMQIGAQYELELDLDFSAGCAVASTVWEGLSLTELAEHATGALQKAKQQGRGRMEFSLLTAPTIPPEPHIPKA